MTLFSRVLLIVATLSGFALLLLLKGWPVPPAPNPTAFTDVVLQPFLAVLWSLIGYLFSALVFGVGVVFAIKVVRLILDFLVDPRRLLSAIAEIHEEAKRSKA